MTQVFLDSQSLKSGNYYNLQGVIKTLKGEVYELDEWIGRGGNAAVFKCVETSTGDEYAIKFQINQSYVLKQRFLREARLLKSLKSDHIVKYFGTGRVSAKLSKSSGSARNVSLHFIILELAENNLQDHMLQNSHKVEYEQYAGQFRGLGKALSDLHSIAIHRDIKPENILISGERWILSDYGLCSFVSEGEEDYSVKSKNIGPKYWLSPEGHSRRLGRGDTMDEGSDVYQLAAIFWYVATGRHPSGILTKDDWVGPERLFFFLNTCLLHNRSKRPANGNEFFKALEKVL